MSKHKYDPFASVFDEVNTQQSNTTRLDTALSKAKKEREERQPKQKPVRRPTR